MNRDLTTGKPSKVLFKFCLPLFGSIVFQQLYNLADSLVAGKFIGENALVAVGNGYEIILIFLSFAIGCNVGCSVIVAKLFGAKKFNELKTAVTTTYIASAALCLIIVVFGLVFCKEMLSLINTPKSVFDDSATYMKIYVASLPFVFLYNVSTGIFSALGDSRTPFYFLAASSLSNIGVDILFVSVFKMGVAGVAWATFLCQGISGILAVLAVMVRLKKIGDGKRFPVFSLSLLKSLAIIAVPSILQQSFISIGNIIIQGVVNTFDESVIAGFLGAMKLNGFAVSSLVTFSNGISNYTAQNIGAEKTERIKQGARSGALMLLSVGLPFALVYIFLGKYCVLLFLNDINGVSVATAERFMHIVAPFYAVVCFKLVADGVLRGASKMVPFMISTFTDLAIRVVSAVLLHDRFGADGVWIGWPIGWVISTVLSVGMYFIVMKKLLGKSKRNL